MNKVLKSKGTIGVISVVVPVVVALLIFLPQKLDLPISIVKWLPTLNATFNSLTTILLIAALYFIRNKNVTAHQWSMQSALILGAFFLVSYVIYHASAPSTYYGDIDHDGIVTVLEKDQAGLGRSVYLILLSSHILLAMIVLPLVLLAFYYAWNRNFSSHKKIVKYTYPVWLYVSVTGVIVYFLIRPYYPW